MKVEENADSSTMQAGAEIVDCRPRICIYFGWISFKRGFRGELIAKRKITDGKTN